MVRTVVLTGGPCSGKSVIAQRLARQDPERFVMVAEAATQVFTKLNTRFDLLDAEGKREVQRAIYRLQLEQEQRYRDEYPDRVMVLDRGTVDGAAYWPDGAEAYWAAVGTTLAAEYARYDRVIWMESSAAVGRYEGSRTNPCRHEDAEAAIECGRRLAEVWAGHAGLVRVGAYASIRQKVAAVGKMIG